MSQSKPNIIFLLVDQLASQVLNLYGQEFIPTPNIDRLAAAGMTFDNMISTCPVCTPYRSMWLTGRHPQTTGHVVNFMVTRHDEIGWGDVFSHHGYDTGYVGKWHLHRGSFPQVPGPDFVPEGRDRLGFRWWRGYNFHMDYFGGTVNKGDWRNERWEGYETDALNRYAFEFLDEARDRDKPFCLMICPHQPHMTGGEFAPESCYRRLPDSITEPNWRHYLAMLIAIDDMVGELLNGIDQRGLTESTILVFTSDHGTHLGYHDPGFWGKKMPWEENVKVPMVIRWPGHFEAGSRCDVLTAPVDLLSTFCTLCDLPIPRTVEGLNLAAAWQGKADAPEQESVLMMNFCSSYDHCMDGWEWRGVRTQTHTYARFLDGREVLYDNVADPRQQRNLIDDVGAKDTLADLRDRLEALQALRHDQLVSGSSYNSWFDVQRRVIANAAGPLPDSESEPDWSLLA